MKTGVLFFASFVSRVSAQLPNFAHGGGTCASDWECSLGGMCVANSCACDPWWTGPTCSYLNLQPAASLTSQGLQAPSYYSWGGHTLKDGAGDYHLFASFMCDHASLGSWTTKSSVAHAVSPSPVGPFSFEEGLDKQLVVPPWSHGAYITRDPPSGQYLLWHLGNGMIDPKTWAPCYNSSQTTAAPPADALYTPLRAPPGQKQAFVHTAPSLNGPWTPWNNNTGVYVSFPAGSWTNGIDNPAPFIFENGTTLLFFRSETCPENWGALAPACIGVARADTWQGPYESLFVDPITHPEGEDPAVFRDPRGNFHMLTNVNTYHKRCPQGVACGGHAWSLDGLTWSNQSIGAFGPVVRFSNGSYYHGAYSERPQVLQAADGTPVAFYMGWGRSSYLDSVNWAQLFCSAGMDPEADCGPQLPPPPPPPTPANPKQGGLCLIANSSNFPCAGGWANSCPLTLGSCSDPTASWVWAAVAGGGRTLQNAAPGRGAGAVVNIDCVAAGAAVNDCAVGTLAKITSVADYAQPLALNGGTLQAAGCPGMCLSGTTSAARREPCKGGEWSAPAQVVLVPCSDASAQGWTV